MKKLKPGDKVKFLNEAGGGTVVSVLNTETAIIALPDGIEIPYPINQLIKNTVHTITAEEIKNAQTTGREVIYLAIESAHKNPILSDEYYVYIYNLSDYQLIYNYAIGKDGVFQTMAFGTVGAFQKNKIKTLSKLVIKDTDTHNIQVLLKKDELHVLQLPIFESIRINEKTFSPSCFINHSEFERPVFIVILKEQFLDVQAQKAKEKFDANFKTHISRADLEKLLQLKEGFGYKPKQTQKKVSQSKQEILEIDLHIEELVDNPAKLTAHQKLQIQLDYFEKTLHEAIASNVKKIIYTHGVGNGRLKTEIRQYLDRVEEKNITYEDASYKTYGFGATIIYI